MSKPLIVYKASAGSGKTFTLATEYIKLVVKNPTNYRNILAVTFTNKATEEMKMRILSQLYGIWKQLDDSRSYMDKICAELGEAPQYVSQQAGLALTNLLHNYNYFRVETIDTFFQSVLRNLARELELTANLRISLNDAQVEELAVDQLIEDLQASDVVLQWLMKYIMENIEDNKSWNVIGQVKSFGKTIFRDHYKQASKEINEKLLQKGFFEQYTKSLRQLRAAALKRMQDIAGQFFDTLEGEGLSTDDLANKNRGIAGFFLKLQNGVLDESIENQTVAKCLDDPAKWYAKSHPRKELLHALAEGELGQLLRTALAERPLQWKRYKSADLTLRHLNQLRLLNSIEQKVHELNGEANQFLLSNTQDLLHSLISESDSPFIFEKTGSRLEHVMFDEFQDTSVVQWQNFKVLLLECMSHEDTENLIVGDVKQSIYRWRSGDWRLLNDIEREFPHPAAQLDVRNLGTNFRSERNIVDFNNAFFRQVAELEYQEQQALSGEAAEQLRRAYKDVCQQVPQDRAATGLVDIRLLPADDYQEATLQAVADVILQLRQQGVSPSRMACLVRTNNLIPLLADYIMAHCEGVKVVSDEAFRLDASLCVRTLVDALRLLAHPDDNLTKANLAKTFQLYIRQSALADNEFLLRDCPLDEVLPEAFTAHFGELLTLPLTELVERLYQLLELDKLPGQSAYLCAFFDELADFLADHPADIDLLLKTWDENIGRKTIQAGELDGLRIISIHKSKGLEFDHVIVPFCDWQLEKQTGNTIWCQPAEPPYNELPLVPVDFSQKGMMGTVYESHYLQEHLQNTVDNLNLLYVAFTRASRNLFVLGKRKTKASRSAVIEQCLTLWSMEEHRWSSHYTLEGLDNEQEPLHFSFGTLSTADTGSRQPKATKNVFLQAVTPVHVDFQTFAAKAEFRQSNKSQTFAVSDEEELEQNNYIQMGNVLHSVFSRISTTADIDTALQELEQEGIIYDADLTAERIAALIRKRLADPRVADWFSDRWTLFNECTILSVDPLTDRVVERRPDRVMTDGRQIIVVDFKFGRPREEYYDQVRQYMQLLVGMGHQNVSGYLWFVYSNQIVEVTRN